MAETVTARDANHHFARLPNKVTSGKEFTVTRSGVPVARIIPARQPDATRHLTPEQECIRAENNARLRRGWPLGIRRLDRNELYDEVVGIKQP